MKKRSFYLKFALLLSSSINLSLPMTLSACISKLQPPYQNSEFVDDFEVEEVEFGKASLIDEKLHGKPTASGEVYDMNDFVAAHESLLFGTCVRVTNLTNGRFVLARINDHRDLKKGWIIELSSKSGKELDISKKDVVKLEVIKSQVGIASWYKYKPEYEPRLTANGEIYDMNAPTAAHRLFPFDTKLKVTNLDDGRAIIVRINDRGPWQKDRIIDLSREAARLIGVIGRGSVRVRLEVVP